MMTAMTAAPPDSDATLVQATLAGNRDAFGQIVSRYQSLICSLAYSATGSLGQSEDLAQETFITAWKRLGHLRERHKLRAWLCGIARNRINNFLRREGREPVGGAEPLENAAESPCPEPLPLDHTITNEEAAILWRSLERIPEIYREPLVLFYREHQSIEAVAQSLDLSEDAVKQRLSRGRKLLQEQILAFVEGALERTRPEKAFTLGVLGALPLLASTPAAASTATATKSGSTAFSVANLGWYGMLLSFPLMFFGNFIEYRMELDSARSEAERASIQNFHLKLMLGFLGAFVVIFGLVFAALAVTPIPLRLLKSLLIGLSFSYALAAVVFVLRIFRHRQRIFPAASPGARAARPIWEYRSRLTLLGVPLVHICLGCKGPNTVKAWIAVGNVAYGWLFAFGKIAVAPLSCGWLALGVLPFGACAGGLLPWGGFSLGGWASGFVAIGWQAYGSCAIAWSQALGWLAFAHDFANGEIARAIQVNGQITDPTIFQNYFFRSAQMLLRYLACLTLLWVVPIFFFWRLQRAHDKTNQSSS